MYSQSLSRSLQAKPDDDANGFAAAAAAAGNAVHVTRTDKSCVLVSMIRLQASESKSFLPNCYCFVAVPAWNILLSDPRDPKSAGFER